MGEPVLSEEDFDNTLNIRIIKLASRLGAIVNRDVLSGTGLSVQHWRFMMALARFGERAVTQVSREANLDPSHGSRVASDLEKRGLVRRTPDIKDGRRLYVDLTEEGVAAFRNNWQNAKIIASSFRNNYSTDEFETLKVLLDRAISQADTMLEAKPATKSGAKVAKK